MKKSGIWLPDPRVFSYKLPGMRPNVQILVYWAPPLGWAALIFVMSSIAFEPRQDFLPYWDKLVHGLIYALLSFFLFRALAMGQQWAAWKACAAAIVLTSLYGITDELHQYFVPLRHADVWDWLADTAGAGLTLLAAARSRGKSPRDT